MAGCHRYGWPDRPGIRKQQLFWLFGLRPEGKSFVSREFSDDEPELDFAARFILDEIGVEFEEPEADKLDSIIDKFGTTFPKTAEFSDLARLTLPQVSAEDDPDAALIPTVIDQNPCAHLRMPRDMIFHGWSMRLFQAWQHSATMSS